MLILYRNKISNHTNKVEYVLKLLGLDYEYKKMDCVRQELMKKELLRIEKKTKTTNVREIVGNIVGE